MANLNQAPKLLSNGEKYKDPNKMGKAIRTHELEMKIMNGLGDRDMAMLKIMLFLTGNANDGSFRVAEKTICERCNISESGYKTARKKLIARGWITLKPGEEIIVNYDNMYNMTTEDTLYKGKKFAEIRPSDFETWTIAQQKELWDKWCNQNGKKGEPIPSFIHE